MGPALRRLKAISLHAGLRTHIKTICIKDDCDVNDPWNTPDPWQSDDIWPRDDLGKVISSRLGISSLKAMLEDGHLRPETIKVVDYHIHRANLDVRIGRASSGGRHYSGFWSFQDATPAGSLAKDIIESVDVAIVSVDMHTVQHMSHENGYVRPLDAAQGSNVVGPDVTEVVIDLLGAHQGQGLGFSLLRSARLRVAPYWLEKVLYHTPILERLEIYKLDFGDASISGGSSHPKLKRLYIEGSMVHMPTIIAVLASSRLSLTDLSFRWAEVSQGSTWQELLSVIDLPNLTSFTLEGLRQPKGGNDRNRDVISFFGFDQNTLAEEYRGVLQLHERGPPHDKRVTRVTFEGSGAAYVLRELALYAKPKAKPMPKS